ncbi:hypothetical protein [Dyadobacter jejuensis]|uniref:hypothetical protein n=1 Tax=Dyadobacter jejuensis TaxID=1082580 RepID=UPI001304857A|nr:hypothetical protein [Dyadobacter jejuensis]
MPSNFFKGLVPESAEAYCQQLFMAQPVHLVVSRPRRTRLGDFTVKPGKRPRVTVNADLNPYSFLITYLHEMAHLRVYLHRMSVGGLREAPHGPQWKKTFQDLLIPVANEQVFPKEILVPLVDYMKNPRASSSADMPLYIALRNFDTLQPSHENKIRLLDLNEGASFVFQNRVFVKETIRRTRVLCTHQASQKRYTIPAHVLVEIY